MDRGFIAVHAGAGTYSSSNEDSYKKICRIACKKGVEVLNSGGSSLQAVTAATAVLEDFPLTNAGYGSNLTIDGTVECDACIMDGNTLKYGAVGAVAGIRNPITLAKKLCDNQNVSLMGRIPPCTLVGPGAVQFAQQYSDILTVHPSTLVSDTALNMYCKYKKQLKNVEHSEQVPQVCDRLDTVGAICVDSEGHTAASCSSGGILLKQPGRIGQAAMFGCGCWAEDGRDGISNVAVTTSGCGEHLVKTILARDLARELQKPTNNPSVTLNENIQKLFLNSPIMSAVDDKLCGLLMIRDNVETGEFLWAHTTPAICIGFMNTSWDKPKSIMSKLDPSVMPGRSIQVTGIRMNND